MLICIAESKTIFDIILFEGLCVSFCVGTIWTRNPVYVIFNFIGIVISIVIISLLMQYEFVALIIALIYIGAIAVLFLFLVLSFVVDLQAKRIEKVKSIIVAIFGIIFIDLLFFNSVKTMFIETSFNNVSINYIKDIFYEADLYSIGVHMYKLEEYGGLVLLCGLVLLFGLLVIGLFRYVDKIE